MPVYKIEMNDETSRVHVSNLVKMLNNSVTWCVEIKKWQKKRTRPQDKLYFEWLGVAGHVLGYSKDDLHDVMKEQFLEMKETEILGRVLRRPRSITSLNVQEMCDFMTKVDKLLTDLGIRLPYPADRVNWI